MTYFSQTMLDVSHDLLDAARAKRIKLASAESCTGGLVAAVLTEIAGSSDVFERGFVTYSNAAKQELLGVSQDILDRFGAVSAESAAAMAEGALRNSQAHLTVSITGVAGPGGGSDEKPVGLVYFGIGGDLEYATTHKELFSGSRHDIRLASVQSALQFLLEAIKNRKEANPT